MNHGGTGVAVIARCAVVTGIFAVTRTTVVAWVVVGLMLRRVVTRDVVVGVVVGRIAAMVVVITVGVVDRIRRRQRSVGMCRVHHRVIAVVVVAIVTRTIVVMWTRADVDYHPRLVAVAIPAEADRLEVFEGGETV